VPDQPNPKAREHPARGGIEAARQQGIKGKAALRSSLDASMPGCLDALPPYVDLHITSNFSFLRGASHPDELVEHAAALGHAAVAITDVNTLAGIVRAHVAAKEARIQLLVGCRIECTDGTGVLLYPTDRHAYARLCRLLTLGKRRAPKGECHLTLHDVIDHQQGLVAVALPPGEREPIGERFIETLQGLRRVFDDDRLSLATSCLYGPDDAARLEQLADLARHTGVPLVATNDVHYHVPQRRPLQDVLTCIRHGCTIENAGLRLFPHAERHLKAPEEMARLFAAHPGAVRRTLEVARRAAGFSLDQVRYEYPEEVCPTGRTPMEHLRDLTWKGAVDRYSKPPEERLLGSNAPPTAPPTPRTVDPRVVVPTAVRARLEHEFALIEDLGYAKYFLTVHDIVRYARSRGILCQGRGAAANSVVCYCLGVTSVDPERIDLLFERFVSKERNEPPDIDIDFEHERREEVIQHIYSRFGRNRAALCAEVITYRGRSAVREVGKAMGLSLDLVDRMAKQLDWWDSGSVPESRLRDLGIDAEDPTIRAVLALTGQVLGFPRHLSQHVGGFVITQSRLDELVPIENAAMEDRTVIEWDKDDIDAMGFLKIDCLGLGMLTAIRKAFDLVHEWQCGRVAEWQSGEPAVSEVWHEGADVPRFDRVAEEDRPTAPLHHSVTPPLCHFSRYQLHTVPPDDPAVYDMICRADTVGVFQVESRAQMSMLPRLRPRCYYDLVIEVAIVRPGPIQGDMVHPYLRRRNKEEEFDYPTPEVRRVLEKTLGVPLFQEQAMQLAIFAAGFSPGEADKLRRAMAAWKRKGDQLLRFEDRFLSGMKGNGYTEEFSRRCFEQLKGFSEYGFPESHAASFALLVYVSSWLKLYHPAAFAAALLNSQPMGFYAPAQLVRDAKEHGVEVLPVDVNHSRWDCTLEPPAATPAALPSPCLRLGMRLVSGLREPHADAVAAAVRDRGPFRSIASLWRASAVPVRTLRALAAADAFRSLGLDRRAALWEARALRDEPLPLYEQAGAEPPPDPGLASLPPLAPERHVIQDYAATGLSLKAHPMSFHRARLGRTRVRPASDLKDPARCPNGTPVTVAGIVLVRQRPGTASGIVFMTIEDETGVANLIIRPGVYLRYRPAARHSVCVIARGVIERQGEVVHVMVSRIDALLGDDGLTTSSRDFH
jgi:error-prone DNA polymerase